jgi:hypothetical protein
MPIYFLCKSEFCAKFVQSIDIRHCRLLLLKSFCVEPEFQEELRIVGYHICEIKNIMWLTSAVPRLNMIYLMYKEYSDDKELGKTFMLCLCSTIT